MKRQLIIIGLDGATFDVIDPLLDEGQLPFMAPLVNDGTRAWLLSTIPCTTMPAGETLAPSDAVGIHAAGEEAESRALGYL